MAHSYRALRPMLARHDGQAAQAYLDRVEHTVYGPKNELLWLMDRAMVQFDRGDHKACVATLERAKALSETLHGVSIKEGTLAWLTDDSALSYQGEDFEKVFLHVLEALSYARAGQLGEARVETRQASSQLHKLAEHLEGKPITYQDDAWAHFLAGLLFEADGQDLSHLSDARIEYVRALQLYETVDAQAYHVAVPKTLVQALARVLEGLGPEGATPREALGKTYPWLPETGHDSHRRPGHSARSSASARVVVVALEGEAAHKVEDAWELWLGGSVYRVAYPRFVTHTRRPPPVVQVRGWGAAVATELVVDLQAVAKRNLADHMERIRGRVMAREVAKYAAGTAAQGVGLSRGGAVGLGAFLAGTALNAVTAAQARADTRSWLTLPEAIYVATIEVPPGEVTLQVGAQEPQTVTVAAQEHRFVVVRGLAD